MGPCAGHTVETIRGFDPGYVSPPGGHHIALAFDKGTPPRWTPRSPS